jgi:EmrB/QacA subfamily drug resistance transporter
MSRASGEPPALTESGMTRRQVLQALSGLLLGMFVSMIASTVVSTSLPLIVSDLKGDQSAYTWVITATLLATTVSTPIWGKLADLMNRKVLLQVALVIFVLSSAIAGFAQDPGSLITMRIFQGLGAGGLGALSQIVMADILSPRERGKYSGLFGAVMALATVGGPLLGGVITDAWGWRWNFFVGLPIAIVALILLQRTLHLPKRAQQRKVTIDYFGILLIAGGFSLLLIWLSLAGSQFDWDSTTSYLMAGGALLLLLVAIFVETKVKEPLIPLGLFKNRTFSLAVVASISVGVAMFGTSVFLSQYMQLARGATPTQSGLLTIPMMGGLLVSSTIVGQLISRRGKWKMYMVLGAALMVVGTALLSRLHYDTNFWYVGVAMFVLGAGVGMVMQNLVLVVQNKAEVRNMGVATSAVSFFRSLGGTVGVTVMGSILGTAVADNIKSGIAKLPAAEQIQAAQHLAGGGIPKLSTLPDFARIVVESSYGTAIGSVFLAAVPLAIVTLIAIIFLPNAPLTTLTATQRAQQENDPGHAHPIRDAIALSSEEIIEAAEAVVAIPTTGAVSAIRPDASSDGSGDRNSRL